MSADQSTNVITIDTSIGYKPVIQADPAKAHYFKDAQILAHRITKEIIVANTQDDKQDTSDNKRKDQQPLPESSPNNLVAFLGGRGSGKTSTMLSVVEAITNVGTENFGSKTPFITANGVCDSGGRVRAIKPINPSHFENNTGIIEVIVSQMFREFLERVNSKNNSQDKPSYDDQKKLLMLFEKVKKSLDVMRGRKDQSTDGDILEQLQELSDTHNLRQHLYDLIREFLNFFGNKTHPLLLVPIDDFDMNFKHAYGMIEDIRKYLILPNVIIYIAAENDLLLDTIFRGIEKSHDLQSSAVKSIDENYELAFQYLFKLIPPAHRVEMPSFVLEEGGKDRKLIIIHEGKESTFNALDKGILRMIFDKTGLIFLPREYELHPIIPPSLRELHGMISLLMEMEDVDLLNAFAIDTKEGVKKTPDQEKAAIRYNCERFREYFFQTWVPFNLDAEQHNILKEALRLDPSMRNFFLIQYLDVTIREGETEEQATSEIYKKISSRLNKGFNISLGDLLYVLQEVVQYSNSQEIKHFTEAVKILYSINNGILILEDQHRNEDNWRNQGHHPRKYSKLQQILNGSVYCREAIQVMRKRADNDRRDVYELDFQKTRTYFDVGMKGIQDISGSHDCLYGVYTTIISLLSRINKEDPQGYRISEKRPYYDVFIAGKTENAQFDVLSFLFSGLNFENVIRKLNRPVNDENEWSNRIKKDFYRYQNPLLPLPLHSIDAVECVFQNFDVEIKDASKPREYFVNVFAKNGLLRWLDYGQSWGIFDNEIYSIMKYHIEKHPIFKMFVADKDFPKITIPDETRDKFIIQSLSFLGLPDNIVTHGIFSSFFDAISFTTPVKDYDLTEIVMRFRNAIKEQFPQKGISEKTTGLLSDMDILWSMLGVFLINRCQLFHGHDLEDSIMYYSLGEVIVTIGELCSVSKSPKEKITNPSIIDRTVSKATQKSAFQNVSTKMRNPVINRLNKNVHHTTENAIATIANKLEKTLYEKKHLFTPTQFDRINELIRRFRLSLKQRSTAMPKKAEIDLWCRALLDGLNEVFGD